MTIEINAQFQEALAAIAEGRHVFVTGRAGTGKSTLLNHFRSITDKDLVVLAPTGVAAVNVGGQTIHSFFRFRTDITPEKAARAGSRAAKEKERGIYQRLVTLVIDEVSMVRADLLDCVDRFLRAARPKRKAPFGGVQLILFGDLYQLPPVITSREHGLFEGHYAGPHFFQAHAVKELDLSLVELEKIYRQSDPDFIEALNAIRNNTVLPVHLELLNSRVDPEFNPVDGFFVRIVALNREADEINAQELARLKGRSEVFDAEVQGEVGKDACPAEQTLTLKAGARVMLLNNDVMGRWVNGTIAKVVAINPDSVEVELEEGSREEVEPFTWQLFRFELEEKGHHITSTAVGSFTQLPLKLAWAVTIHKAQGKTFDRAIIDISRTFAPGQVYVALSRLTSLEGLVLRRPLRKQQVFVDRAVVRFFTGHHYAISEQAMPLAEKIALIEDAIHAGQLLSITYLKASDEKSQRVVKPISVGEMEYGGRTFPGMRALCDLRGDERTFRVDRILAMRVMEPEAE
jgi:ATP-dependent exoDNAse (exonuclease V) alpha subunit